MRRILSQALPPARRRAAAVAVATALAFASPAAHAFDSAAVVAAIQVAQQYMSQFMSNQFTNMQNGFNKAVSALGAQISAETGRATAVQIANERAIADYEARQRMLKDMQEIEAKLQQPGTTCQTMSVAGGLSAANVNAVGFAGTITAARAAATVGFGSRNVTGSILAARDGTLANYCSDDDAKMGRKCTPVAKDMQAADVNAARLFSGGPDNKSLTYSPQQEMAATAFATRLRGTEVPEALDSAALENTPDGALYHDMQRRYAAAKSVADYSISSIQALRTNQPSLASDARIQQLLGKGNGSILEVMDAFIRMKFSPANIMDSATATDPNKILRDMLQVQAFRLWMEFLSLQSTDRQEALAAAQLYLTADSVLLPQLKQQRAAVSRGNAPRN